MTETNGKEDDAFRVRVCEAIQQLGPHEVLKAVRVATFPLDAMPDGRAAACGGSFHRTQSHHRRRVHQLVGVGGTPGTTGGEPTATGKGGREGMIPPDGYVDEYWGNCPMCHRAYGYVNLGEEHWFCCETHRVRWRVGIALFSIPPMTDEEYAAQQEGAKAWRRIHRSR
jgi:hypothetical protein